MTTKLLVTLVLAFLHAVANAQDVAADAPVAEGDVLGTVIFGIVFIAMCVGFVWLVWRNDKRQK
jgi:hypothetical protein